jgi:hypothetical protein
MSGLTESASKLAPHGSPANARLWQVDALRGLMQVLMTITHLPTLASTPTGQPFGFVSAAEGFVMLSAFMAGLVYSGKALRDGIATMRMSFIKRALKIYGSQAALLLFLFSFVAVLGLTEKQHSVTDLMAYYISNPVTALVAGLLLVYNPPLLDILPMYILFMLMSPPILGHGLKHGWNGILIVSITLWLLAQFGLGEAVYGEMQALTGMPIPYQLAGSFGMFAWQFLWILGLWMGATVSISRVHHEPSFPPFPKWMVVVAVAVALALLGWRHLIGQVPFPQYHVSDWHNALFDKWHLGPFRIIDFLAILIVTMRFGPGWCDRLPRMKWLEMLGSASLPVFCAQLVVVLLLLATFGEWHPKERSNWIDVAILVASFALLTGIAWVSHRIDEYAARFKKQREIAKASRAAERAIANLADA